MSVYGAPITCLAWGSGPMLLAVHGGLGGVVSMLPLAGHPAEHYTAVAMNCRGHGTSGNPQSAPEWAGGSYRACRAAQRSVVVARGRPGPDLAATLRVLAGLDLDVSRFAAWARRWLAS